MTKTTIVKGKTPAQLGFAFPAEWEPHSGTWFSWPRPEGISFPERYETIPANFAAIIREITPRELVHVNVPNENYEKIVSATLRKHRVNLRRVRFHHIKTNENWCRDHGPAFIVRTRNGKKETAVVDWGYNAWGGKYPAVQRRRRRADLHRQEARLPRVLPGDRDGRGRDRRQRARLVAHDRVVPPQQEPQPGSLEAGDRAIPPRLLRAAEHPVARRRDRGRRYRRAHRRPGAFHQPDNHRGRRRTRSERRELQGPEGEPPALQAAARPRRQGVRPLHPAHCRARSSATASGCRRPT